MYWSIVRPPHPIPYTAMFNAATSSPRPAHFVLYIAAVLSAVMLLFPPFTSLTGTEYAFLLTGPEWSRWAEGLGEGLDLSARIHWVLLLVQLAAVWAIALGSRKLLVERPAMPGLSPLLLGGLVVASGLSLTARPAEAQIFGRLKEAAGRAVQGAGEAARDALVEGGMQEATFLMLQDGQFSGTATPWFSGDGSPALAFADVPGQAFASPSTLAFVLCQGPDALDALLLQGDFAPGEGGEQTYTLANNDFSVLLVRDGRTYPVRNTATRPGALSGGTLTLERGEGDVRLGTVSLTIDEGAAVGSALRELFQRSRLIEINGSFRAAPAESIESVACDG